MQSQRVRLREHVIEDLESFCDWQMDSAIAQYLSWLPRTRDECAIALLDAIEQQTAPSRVRYYYAVERVQTGEIIGDVGFTKTSAASADCGWFVRRQFWGNGYASEAVRCLLSLAFGGEGLEHLTASALLLNRASIRVAEKCGFQLGRKTQERAWFYIVASACKPGESDCPSEIPRPK